MNHGRRTALLLAAGMVAASALGSLARPRRLADDQAMLDLEHIFPTAFGSWQVDPVAAHFVRPANEASRKLYQRLLERTYVDGSGNRVMLSVAYGSEQASGLVLHWPEVCYRYGGFSVSDRQVVQIVSSGRSVPVTRLVATQPMRPEPVTYWAVLGGERIPDANTFRLHRLAHAMRREIADGMLVRVSSIDPDAQRAFALHADFIDRLARALAPDARAVVEGQPAAA